MKRLVILLPLRRLHARFILDESSMHLMEKMRHDYPQLSLAEFMNYVHDARQGGG